MHPCPQPWDEGVARLGVLERGMRAEADGFIALHGRDDDLADLGFTLTPNPSPKGRGESGRKVSAQKDLLRPCRDVGERFGVDAGHLEALEFDLDVAQR